jgi:hypothetical protein
MPAHDLEPPDSRLSRRRAPSAHLADVPPLVGLWMVAGIVLYFVVRSRRAEAVASLGEAVS